VVTAGPPSRGPDAAGLDAAQSTAVRHARGPARVLAPAGSGKTKTLVSRVDELVRRGADPASILLLAFNRKAAEQLEERLAALGIPTTRRLGRPQVGGRVRRRGDAAGRAGVHCATFNAFGYRYQRQVMGARVTVDLDGTGLRALMRGAMEASGAAPAALKPARGSDPVGAFLDGLTSVRAALEDPAGVAISVDSTGAQPVLSLPFADTHECYLRAQLAAGRQSFDDQIYFAVVDLLAHPGRRRFVQEQFAHVLVDEFQDLNGAQLALVDVLSRPGRELFVVGDDDQLIYGWRHADPRGILEFHRREPPPPWSATYTLGTNYRCSRAVVEAGARLVANNAVREAKQIRPRDGAHEGAVLFAGAPSWPQRAAALCDFLRAEKTRLGCAWRDLAVLCRYRSQQLLVALALDDGGIPRTPTLGCRLFTHPAARLLRAYVALVDEPGVTAGPELGGLLNRPNRYVSAAAVEAIGAAAHPWRALTERAAREPVAGRRPLTDFAAQVEALGAALRTVRHAGPGSGEPLSAGVLVWAIVDEFGLEDFWSTSAASGADGASDGAGPLQVFDALLLLAEARPDPDAFLAAWDRLLADEEAHAGSADDTLAREESGDDRVVIGTIHAAKGREYHSVVIPDYDCDVTRWEPAAIEEERRVVYVGVTRARDAALFTVDTSRPYVHPFLRELVQQPDSEEHETLTTWLAEEADEDLCHRIAARLREIAVLFPELAPASRTLGPCAPEPCAPGGAAPAGAPT
jgi:superfamily I DNA/RNA helicase